MIIKNEKSYLLQVAIPFVLLGYFKWKIFYFVAIVILLSIPIAPARKVLINSWVRFGSILQSIFSPLVIGAIYFLVLTPLAVLRRFISKDSALRLSCPKETNFQDHLEVNNEEQYKELW